MHPHTVAAAVVTVLTIAALLARQIVGMRPGARAPRWLTALTVVLLIAFVVAMGDRLSSAL